MTETELMNLVCSEAAKKIAKHSHLADVVMGKDKFDEALDLWVAANIVAFVNKLKGIPSVSKAKSFHGVYEIEFDVASNGKVVSYLLKTTHPIPTRYYLKITSHEFANSEHTEWEQIGITQGNSDQSIVGTMTDHHRNIFLHARH